MKIYTMLFFLIFIGEVHAENTLNKITDKIMSCNQGEDLSCTKDLFRNDPNTSTIVKEELENYLKIDGFSPEDCIVYTSVKGGHLLSEYIDSISIMIEILRMDINPALERLINTETNLILINNLLDFSRLEIRMNNIKEFLIEMYRNDHVYWNSNCNDDGKLQSMTSDFYKGKYSLSAYKNFVRRFEKTGISRDNVNKIKQEIEKIELQNILRKNK